MKAKGAQGDSATGQKMPGNARKPPEAGGDARNRVSLTEEQTLPTPQF